MARRMRGRGAAEKTRSTKLCSDVTSARVRIIIHSEGKSCSMSVRALVLDDPPWRSVTINTAELGSGGSLLGGASLGGRALHRPFLSSA